MNRDRRSKTFEGFDGGDLTILVTTDIGSRGLDMKESVRKFRKVSLTDRRWIMWYFTTSHWMQSIISTGLEELRVLESKESSLPSVAPKTKL